MKRLICMLLALTAVLTVSGCQMTDHGRSGTDYNQYLESHGFYALLDSNAVILNEHTLYELDPATSSAHELILSGRPIDQKRPIYASRDKLYYVEDREYALYCMDSDGQNRVKVKTLGLLNELSQDSLGYSYAVYGEYLLVEVETNVSDRHYAAIYKTTVADDVTQLEPLFGSIEDDSVMYTKAQRRGDWIFAVGRDADGIYGLYCYSLTEGKVELLIENWVFHASYPVVSDSNELYWFFPGDGFYKMPLDTRKTVKLRSAETEIEDGYNGYDDRYMYLSNNVKLDVNIPEEEQGVRIYDYSGNLVCFLMISDLFGKPAYAFSTSDRVYFYNADIKSGTPDMIPLWWINKDKIADGAAEWMPVDVD